MSQEKKILIVFAGPNGSGKSSLINKAYNKAGKPSLYINADDITTQKIGNLDRTKIEKAELDKINLEAAIEADKKREEAISQGKSFATETVMSTPAKINLMRQAKEKGYEVHLIYVTTQDSKINIDRVQERVQKGGHAVPPEKTEARYIRAMELLPQAIQVADIARIYNNSLENPVKIMEKTIDNEIKIYPQNPPNMQSKWTLEELEEIKNAVIKIEEQSNRINSAPSINKVASPSSWELQRNQKSKELYDQYAKEALAGNGNKWNDSLDEVMITKMLLKKDISDQTIISAMKNSPSMKGLSSIDQSKKIRILTQKVKLEHPELTRSKGMER